MTNTTITRFKNSLHKLEEYKHDYRTKFLSNYLNGVMIGLLLSDGSIQKSSPNSSARLSVIFSEKHLPYLLHLYNLFEPYIDNYFDLTSVYNKSNNKYYNIAKFKTASLPVFLYYYKMFYKYDRVSGKYKKIIPSNIAELISPIALAHLIMGDGNLKIGENIIRIYTNSFTKKEVEKLAYGILKQFDIKVRTVHDRNDQYILVISSDQLDKLTSLILPYMHSSMVYKLGCINKDKAFKYSSIKQLI